MKQSSRSIFSGARAISRPRDIKSYLSGALTWLDQWAEASRFWDHQREAVSALRTHFDATSAIMRGFVVIPTGGGKTAVFTALVDATARYGRISANGETARTVLLVPNLNLIGQVLREFRLHHPDVDIGYKASRPIMDADGVTYRQRPGATTVMTYARFMRAVDNGSLTSEDVDLIVMDEAHRGLSDMRQGVITSFFEKTAVIAFSATPEFEANRSLDGLLGAENLVYAVEAQRLRDEGILAPVVNYVLAVKMRELPEDDLERVLVRRKGHVDEILSFIEDHVDERTGLRMLDKVTVFYGSNRFHARMFASEYNSRLGHLGKRMEFLSGEDNTSRIQDVIAGINAGTITGISNAQLLTEGFDVRRIGLVINSPSESGVKIVQQSGRAQRIDDTLDRHDVEQTAFVLDTYLEIDGEMEGTPRWFFEAEPGVDTLHVARGAVDAVAVDVADYTEGVDLAEATEETDEGNASDDTALEDNPASEEETPPDDIETGKGSQAGNTGEAFVETFERQGIELVIVPDDDEQHRLDDEVASRGEFSSDASIHAIRYLLAKRRLNEQLDEKTDEWLSRGEIIRTHGDAEEFFDALEEEFFAKRVEMTLDSDPITRSWSDGERTSDPVSIRMDLRRSNNKTVVCYHRDCTSDLMRVSGATLDGYQLSPEWKTRLETIDAVGARPGRVDSVLRRCLQEFQVQERLQSDPEGVVVDGMLLRMRRVANGAFTYVAYREDAVATLRQIAGIAYDEKEEGEVSRSAFCRMHSISPRNEVVHEAFAAMERSILAGEQPTVGGVPIEAAMRYHMEDAAVYVAPGSLHELARVLDVRSLRQRVDRWELHDDLPDRTEGWLLRNEVFSKLRTSYREDRPLGKLWDRLLDTEEVNGIRTVDGRPFRMQLMRSFNRASVYLHEDEVDRFRASAADKDARFSVERMEAFQPRTEEWLTGPMAAKEIRTTHFSAGFVELWTSLEESIMSDGIPEHDGHRPSMSIKTVGTSLAACIHRDELTWIDKAFWDGVLKRGPKRKGEGTRADIARKIGVNDDKLPMTEAWKRLEETLASGTAPAGLRARFIGHGSIVVMDVDDADAFAEWANLKQAGKPDDYLSRDEVMEKLLADFGRKMLTGFNALWEALGATDKPVVDGQTVRTATYPVSRRTTEMALHRDDYHLVREAVRPPEPLKPAWSPKEHAEKDADRINLGTAWAMMSTTSGSDRASQFVSMVQSVIDGSSEADRYIEVDFDDQPFVLQRASTPGKSGLHVDDIHRLGLVLDAGAEEIDDEWRLASEFRGPVKQDTRKVLEDLEAEFLHLRRRGETGIVLERMPALTASELADAVGLLPDAKVARLPLSWRRKGNSSFLAVRRDGWEEMERVSGAVVGVTDSAEGYLSREEAFALLGITFNTKVNDAMDTINRRYAINRRLTGDDMPIEVSTGTVRCRRVRRGVGSSSVHFHPDDVWTIATSAGYHRPKPEEWLDRAESARAFKVNAQTNQTFVTLWERVVSGTEAGIPVVIGDCAVRTAAYAIKGKSTICLHEDEIPHVADVMDFVIEDRTPRWIDKSSAAKLVGTGLASEPFASTWQGMISTRDAREDVILAGEVVAFRKMASGSRAPYCLHEDGLPALVRSLGLVERNVPAKTPDWIGSTEFCQPHRTQTIYGVDELWEELVAGAEAGNTVEIEGAPVLAGRLKNGPHVVNCVHRDCLPAIRRQLGWSDPIPEDDLASSWRSRSSIPSSSLTDEETEWLNAMWSEALQDGGPGRPTLLADSGVRLRYDPNGSGRLLRVHVEDIDLLVDFVRESGNSPRP